jgi:hypothetical protein
MAGAPISDFEPDEDRLAVIRECIENYDVGDPMAEWPNNVISRHTVVYSSGVISRKGASIRHAVDPDELALCRRLSLESSQLMEGVEVGMGSNRSASFRDFFIAANVDDPVESTISGALIRTKFGGTLFPPITITAEPLTAAGIWWSEVQEDGAESSNQYFLPWQRMIRWFRGRPEFLDTRFVRIGHNRDLSRLLRETWPPGTKIFGCVLPRLALGITLGGSLVGLFGYAVTP